MVEILGGHWSDRRGRSSAATEGKDGLPSGGKVVVCKDRSVAVKRLPGPLYFFLSLPSECSTLRDAAFTQKKSEGISGVLRVLRPEVHSVFSCVAVYCVCFYDGRRVGGRRVLSKRPASRSASRGRNVLSGVRSPESGLKPLVFGYHAANPLGRPSISWRPTGYLSC